MKGQILIISGPSGSGKSTLLKRLLKEYPDLYFSISSTTRNIRNGEKEGVNYHYISKDEFKEGIKNDEFLEWAFVHENYYGTNLKPVLNALNNNKIVIFDIDVQGYKTAKKKFKNINSVFITSPSISELKNRLLARGSDDEKSIEKRLENALNEIKYIQEYDYLLINDELSKTYEGLKSILNSIKFKTYSLDLSQIINYWIK